MRSPVLVIFGQILLFVNYTRSGVEYQHAFSLPR